MKGVNKFIDTITLMSHLLTSLPVSGSDTRHLATSLVTNREDDVCSHDLKSERASSRCQEDDDDDDEDAEEEEDDEEEDRGADVDDISSAFSLRLYDRDEGLRSPVSGFQSSSAGQYSIEALLANIQGLIKMAAENARHREQQTRMEKGEPCIHCKLYTMLY